MPYYRLILHDSKCVQSNKMLNNEQNIQEYIYSCDNSPKFKRNKEVYIIKR